MTKDLANTTLTEDAFTSTTTYVPSANPSLEPATTSEEIAAQMESKARNLGNGLGEALGETSVGKFLQGVSTGISYVADALVSFVPSLPLASAEPIKNDPKNSPQVKTAQKLKSATTKPKITGRYTLEELQVSEDKIYFDCEKGDWFFSLRGLKPLNKLYPDLQKQLPFYLVKRSELFDIVKKDSYEDFRKLVLKARSDMLQQLKEKNDLIRFLFESELAKMFNSHSSWSRSFSDESIMNLAIAISKNFNFECSPEFQQKIKVITKDTGNSNMLDDLKNTVITHLTKLQTESNIKSQWEKIKEQDLTSGTKSSNLLKEYRNREKLNLENEKYFDRVEKFKKLNHNPNFKCIFSNKQMTSPGVSVLGEVQQGYPTTLWLFSFHLEEINSRTITHESLHSYDFQVCLAEGSGFNINFNDYVKKIIKIPCSNEPIIDNRLSTKLKMAFDLDYNRFQEVADEGQKKPYTKDALTSLFNKKGYKIRPENIYNDLKILTKAFYETSGYAGDMAIIEIITEMTDILSPSQLVSLCPNIAVVRSKTIYNDGRDGTALYMAIMQCDVNSVKDIIKKNPSVLNEEYDGIKLHELPKMLVEAGYDKFVDKSFKKDNKNNYVGMKSLIQKEYEAYKNSKVKNLSDQEKKSSIEREL